MSRSDAIATWRWYGLVGLVVGLIALPVGLLQPEVRCGLGLECDDERTPRSETTTTTSPASNPSTASEPSESPSSTTTSTLPPPTDPPASSLPPTPTVTVDTPPGGYCPVAVVLQEGRSWNPPDLSFWDESMIPAGEPVQVRAHHDGTAERLDIDGQPYLPTGPVELVSLQADCELRTVGRLSAGEEVRLTLPAGSGLFYRLLQEDYQPGGRLRPAGTISDGWYVNGQAADPDAEQDFAI